MIVVMLTEEAIPITQCDDDDDDDDDNDDDDDDNMNYN